MSNPSLSNWKAHKSTQTTTQLASQTNAPAPSHAPATQTNTQANNSGNDVSGNLTPPNLSLSDTPTTKPAPQVISTSTPTITSVDISIAGTPHRISCPSSEVATLNRISDEMNDALRDIRRAAQGKNLNNEALLVLHCLDLYDRIATLQEKLDTLSQNHQSASALIDKIIKDTQAVI